MNVLIVILINVIVVLMDSLYVINVDTQYQKELKKMIVNVPLDIMMEIKIMNA